MDTLESLLAKNFDVVNRLGNGMIISFCSWIPDLGNIKEESVRSIDNIGKEIGFSYEIIVSGGVRHVSAGEERHHLMRMFPELSEVIVEDNKSGIGKNIAFENSAGKFIIMFDAETVYNLNLADMIHNFILSGIKKMVFSPLVIIPRMIINEVGRWRELTDGEDIDFYTRVALSYGILAFPFNGFGKGKGTFVLPAPEYRGIDGDNLRKRILHLRDNIIGCNYSPGDIRSFLHSKSGKLLIRDAMLYGIAYALSKISPIKPFRFDRNNYLVVLESLLESLVLKEYTRIDTTDMPIRFKMSDMQISYLKDKSRLYSNIKDSIVQYGSNAAWDEA